MECLSKRTVPQTRYRVVHITRSHSFGLSDSKIPVVVVVNKRTAEKDKDVSVEDMVQTPEISHSERLNNKTALQYFEQNKLSEERDEASIVTEALSLCPVGPSLETYLHIGIKTKTTHDKFDDDIQKVTPARAPLAFSLLSNSALMSKSFSFDLLRLRAKTAWLWLPQSASLTVRCPQRYVHRDQRRI
ncbi:hypothetical protein TNCV_832911 [Trichonephila clavipes]|uniref:Uncharacterized protein n=1 Tax=Trichonephila clavipes TaxID=2585209 RepID=A0A8X6R5A0_TRICX|nr:hypothetical protein TNCV_832911 [Trichonephila clavipes]